MSSIKLGRVNMPKLLRQMRHRTSQVRDLVFIRDPIYRKSTKTTKSGGTLAGPAVNFGYEENLSTARTEGSDAAYHADSPELILPGLKCLQSPVISRSGELERTGHRITGACTFYAPSLDYILALDNFSETTQFNELETYDKLIDIERIIYTATDYSATSTSHTIKTFDDKSAGYQLDRLQFKIKSGTTLTKIALSGNEGGTTKSLTWSGSLALSSSEYITIDVPLRDIDAGETTSVYKDGVRTELTAGTDNTILDIDKLYGASTYDLLSLVLTTSSGLVELKDIYFYKEAEWRIQSIKDYRDEYMEIGAVRVRGDRGSRRRAYG
jgi:hypothetical protein